MRKMICSFSHQKGSLVTSSNLSIWSEFGHYLIERLKRNLKRKWEHSEGGRFFFLKQLEEPCLSWMACVEFNSVFLLSLLELTSTWSVKLGVTLILDFMDISATTFMTHYKQLLNEKKKITSAQQNFSKICDLYFYLTQETFNYLFFLKVIFCVWAFFYLLKLFPWSHFSSHLWLIPQLTFQFIKNQQTKASRILFISQMCLCHPPFLLNLNLSYFPTWHTTLSAAVFIQICDLLFTIGLSYAIVLLTVSLVYRTLMCGLPRWC